MSVLMIQVVLATIALLVVAVAWPRRAGKPTQDKVVQEPDWAAMAERSRRYKESPEARAAEEAYWQSVRDTAARHLAQEKREREAERLALGRQLPETARQQVAKTQNAMLADPKGHFLKWLRQP